MLHCSMRGRGEKAWWSSPARFTWWEMHEHCCLDIGARDDDAEAPTHAASTPLAQQHPSGALVLPGDGGVWDGCTDCVALGEDRANTAPDCAGMGEGLCADFRSQAQCAR